MNKKLSESGIIDLIKRRNPPASGVRVGIGDDAAVLRAQRGDWLFTTDMLVENVHFKLKDTRPDDLGRKAMSVNLSDIAAMGGVPAWAVVSVGLPKRLSKAGFVRKLYEGLEAAAKASGASIVGGDTNRSDKLVISVALLGYPAGKAPLTRAGAKVGDVICVTGALGNSYRSKKHLRFTPRLAEAAFLARGFKVNAMMDLSDGLGMDLPRLARESKVGAAILGHEVPLARGASLRAALGDGEDFELLFTLPPKEAARLLRRAPKRLAPFRAIGRIVPPRQGVRLVLKNGLSVPLKGGFDHFAA